MRINFILGSPWLNGGSIVVCELANRLTEMGHAVAVIWPRGPVERRSGLRGVKDLLRQLKGLTLGTTEGRIEYMEVKADLLEVPSVAAGRFIPDADATVATAWRTAEWVYGLPPSKGHKFYLIQHYETWDGPKDRVDRTWKMPLTKIVVSSWLKNIAEHQFSERVYGPLLLGVNSEQFHNDHKVFSRANRIGMLYSTRDWKGVSDGLQVLEIVRTKYPEMELVMFGAHHPASEIPPYASFYFQPPRAELYKIYSMCDIWLCPSWMEGGPPMPSQEAAACKCAVVTTDVGAARDFFRPGESALFAPPRDVNALASDIFWLIENPKELERIALAGYERVRQLTWEHFGVQFMACLSVVPQA